MKRDELNCSKIEQLKNIGDKEKIHSRWSLNPSYPAPTDAELVGLKVAEELNLSDCVIQTSGVSVRLGSHIDPYLTYLLCADAYEFGDLRLISDYAIRAKKAVVMGGGIGVIAAALANKSGANVTVYDANSNLIKYINDTGNINEVNLITKHAAIAKVGGASTKFYLSSEFWASSTNADAYKYSTTVEVQTIAFLDALDDAEIAFIDIEGGEVDLFFDKVPSTLNQIFIEIHTPSIGSAKGCEIMNRIWNQGFKLVEIEGLTSFWSR